MFYQVRAFCSPSGYPPQLDIRFRRHHITGRMTLHHYRPEIWRAYASSLAWTWNPCYWPRQGRGRMRWWTARLICHVVNCSATSQSAPFILLLHLAYSTPAPIVLIATAFGCHRRKPCLTLFSKASLLLSSLGFSFSLSRPLLGAPSKSVACFCLWLGYSFYPYISSPLLILFHSPFFFWRAARPGRPSWWFSYGLNGVLG